MLAAYGVDVLDPRVTPRRIWLLAQRLPPWARTPGETWSTEAELLALLIDHVAQLTWVTLRAAGAKNAQQPRPLPRPRRAQPPQRQAPQPKRTWGEAVAQLAGIPGVTVSEEARG